MTATLTNFTLSGHATSGYASGAGLDVVRGTENMGNVPLNGNTAGSRGGTNLVTSGATLAIVTLNGNAPQFRGGAYEFSQYPTQTLRLANTSIAIGPVGGDCYMNPSGQSAVTTNGCNFSRG